MTNAVDVICEQANADSALRVTSISAGSSHTAALLTGPGGSYVVTCGRGEDGQLGHGTAGDQQAPLVVEALRGRQPSDVVCGAEYTFAICKGGEEVFSWGWGDFGRLGHGDCSDVFIPRLVTCLQGLLVRRIACGDQHTLVLLHDGQLLSFGRNQNGQLGNGSTKDCPQARPIANFASASIVDIACGAEHSLCLTDKACAYAWGWGAYGNLGTGAAEDEILPVPITGLDDRKIIAVATGWRHSFVVDSEGQLLAFGWNKYGQVGNGKFDNVLTPEVVGELQNTKVKLVDGGWRHTVATTAHGVYAWGWNKFGQLGLGTVDENPSVPHKLAQFAGADDPIEHISAGWKHTMFVTATGAVFATGRGNNGQLCMPVKGDLLEPTRVDTLSCGSIKVDEQEATGKERMYVPASDRYAVVPGSEEPDSVPSSVPVAAYAEPKRARLT